MGSSSAYSVTQVARGFAVYAAQSDQALLASATATSTSSSTSTNSASSGTPSPGASGPPVATDTSTATPETAPSSHGLSAGAKAGIGVGVAIGVLLIIVGVFIFLRRRKRGSPAQVRPSTPTDGFEKSELPGEGKQRGELDAANAYEVGEAKAPAEMYGSETRAELETHWNGSEMPVQRQ